MGSKPSSLAAAQEPGTWFVAQVTEKNVGNCKQWLKKERKKEKGRNVEKVALICRFIPPQCISDSNWGSVAAWWSLRAKSCLLKTTGKESQNICKLQSLFPVLSGSFFFCVSHCGDVLMREKQLSETCWGVKIYFPHFLCVKILFLICSNPAVAFTQQGDSVAFKATLKHWHTSYTRGCLPRWRVWEQQRAKEN